MAAQHRVSRRVQFHEVDLAGLVHFSWYFRYMEEAEHALWRASGLRVAAPGDDLRYPRVSASFDYRAPLRFDDEFEIAIRVEAMSARSIRYACEVGRGDAQIATGSMTIVCVSVAPGAPLKAIDFPPWIRERLQVQNGI